ncbi:hypothetical protein F5X68DRAFT_259846 [Plectosphaerella plurivora]|uniref:RBR-type E3 ubiquitin transferase n=1 Tax=Plectosphaerella plurivora TaxID=936078 RepID=A0A9P8VHE0_9PEZI|nr:hypothetical protein F5X68DRAFT_259846 [Plectosphaerella plurivora]
MASEVWSEVMDSELKAATSATTLITPGDFIDFYGDPSNTVSTTTQRQWKGKGRLIPRKAIPPPAKVDTQGDLTKYDIPDALASHPAIDSELLIEVVTSSIERVRARVTEEETLKREQSISRRQREEQDGEQLNPETSNGEPYLPINIPEKRLATGAEAETNSYVPNRAFLSTNGEGSSTGAGLILFPQVKARTGTKFKLSRLFKRREEKKTVINPSPSPQTSYWESVDTSTLKTPTPNNVNLAKPPQLVECVSCLDDFPDTLTIKAPCHNYCPECFERLIVAACQNEQQWPPKCCLNDIPAQTISAHIPKTLAKTYKARSAEWGIPISDRIYCAHPNCSLFVAPDRIDRATRVARCTARHTTCTICRDPAHPNAECPRDRDLELTEALAEEQGWVRCAQCRAFVEHREACGHMTCRCGYQFCYVCNAVWKTCACTQDALRRKKSLADTRQRERQVRETQEDEEIREALRQIAEFEREEALKAEMLRQETLRQEDERRQRELEERVRLESLRRSEVEKRYAEFRVVLADLHTLQREWIENNQVQAIKLLDVDITASVRALVLKHETERAQLDIEAAEKIRAKEAAFAKDFAIRVAAETALENTHLANLNEVYAGKRGCEERVAHEIRRYRRQLDSGWRVWQKWRDTDTAAHRVRVEEERAIADELMVCAMQRHKDGLEERKRDLAARKVVEWRWVELVVEERERMLDELEIEELDNGGEAASLFASSEEAE